MDLHELYFSGNKENCVNGIYKISYKEPAH